MIRVVVLAVGVAMLAVRRPDLARRAVAAVRQLAGRRSSRGGGIVAPGGTGSSGVHESYFDRSGRKGT